MEGERARGVNALSKYLKVKSGRRERERERGRERERERERERDWRDN